MAAKKARKLGEVVEVPKGAVVVRPDDEEVTVSGGLYVLSMPGAYRIGDDELEAK